jgi:cytochrome c biogenesis protein CcmG/thiol:disulfide interchange protein DsbE
MKRTLVIVGTVIALVALVIVADRATRRTPSHAAKAANGVDIAEMAPDFTLKDLKGNDVSLGQYRGKVVLINFWATWCDPCRVEIPWLIEMQDKYGPRGFVVLGIAMDEDGRKAVEPYVQKERFTVNGDSGRAMNYPILLGNDTVADKFGGLIGFPTSVLISKDGRQVKRITGLISYDEIAKAIESLL